MSHWQGENVVLTPKDVLEIKIAVYALGAIALLMTCLFTMKNHELTSLKAELAEVKK